MSAIEVKRVGDGSTRAFDINEIGDGTLLDWVTQNDSTADGLVRFLNQSGETGNAMAPDSLKRFPMIVEDGSLITDATEIELTWEATDPDINHYNVYRSTTSGSGFSKINTSNISSKSYIDDSVSEGETYYYKASSVDSSGNESDLSDEISVVAKDVITVFSEGFESDLSNWNANNNFERKTDAVYAGSYSGGKDAGDYAGPDEAVASISPTQINEISWYWREESSQYGSSISLYNSNGDRELAAGTENPEWTFWDDTGQDDIIYSTGVYETWMYIRLHNFDWANGTYDYYYENTNSGHVETGTRSMNHGVDVSEIWLGTRPNDTSGPLYCRWDEIEVLS